MKVLALSILLGGILLGGCYYDNKDYLYPSLDQTCTDTISPVTYEGAVSRILNDNCVTCHRPGNIHGNVMLDSYTNVKAQVDNGQLIGSIFHTNGFTGPKAMPPGGSLDDCSLNTIKKWVNNKAPQK